MTTTLDLREKDSLSEWKKWRMGIIKHEEFLREQAIKWVKEDIEEHYNLFRDVLKGRKIISPTITLIKKWMKRLNITEEDLK